MSSLDALAASFGLRAPVATDPSLVISKTMLEAHRHRPSTSTREEDLAKAAAIRAAYYPTSVDTTTNPHTDRQEEETRDVPVDRVTIPLPKTDKDKILEAETCKTMKKQVNSLYEKQKKEQQWGKLPKQEKTEILERDIEVVRRRSSLDPSKHYKLTGWEKGKHPYVVSGDVVLSAYEQHRQLPKKLRGNSLFDELVKNDKETRERLARRADKIRNTRKNKTVIRISKRKPRRGRR